MKYWIAWLQSLSVKIEIQPVVHWSLNLLFIGFFINLPDKLYRVWITLPKYALILTNQKGFPYMPTHYFLKKGHFYICHAMGRHLQEIKRGSDQ